MSLEQQVIDLTQVTEQLLQAVNTRKVDLDTAETNASLSAQIAASAERNALSAAEMVNIQSGLVLQAVNNPGLIAVGEDLTTSNTIGTVATDINAIAIVAQNISDVTLLADVTAVAENIADIETTVDNLPSILAASTVPYSTRTGPAIPPCPPRKIGAWSSMTPRGTSPSSDAVALSPCGV